MGVVGLDNVVLLVRDLEASRRFYEDVLDFAIVRDEYINAALHMGRDGRELLSLYHVTDVAAPPRPNATEYFRVTWQVERLEDLDTAERALRVHDAWGGRGPQNPRTTGLGTAYGTDPDGNRFELRWMHGRDRTMAAGDGT